MSEILVDKKYPNPKTPRLSKGFFQSIRSIHRQLYTDPAMFTLLSWCLAESTIERIHIFKYKIHLGKNQLITSQREIQRELGLRRVGLKERLESLQVFGVCVTYYKDLMLIDVSNYYATGGNGCNHFSGNGCNHFLPQVGTAVTTRWERLVPLIPRKPNNDGDFDFPKEEEKDLDNQEGEEKEIISPPPFENGFSNFWVSKKPHENEHDENVRQITEVWRDMIKDRRNVSLDFDACSFGVREMFKHTNCFDEIMMIFNFIAESKDAYWLDKFSHPKGIFKIWKNRFGDDGRRTCDFKEAWKKSKKQK